jgi:hypothetical protein
MGLECQLLAPAAGGNPFDEACSCPWAELADRFPGCPIPMACEAVTVELRGDTDVYDELAVADAAAIFRFLQRRGYISEKAVAVAGAEAGAGAEAEVEVGMDGVATTATKAASAGASLPPLPPLLRPATPLTGVDMVEAPCAGVVAWRVQPGQEVWYTHATPPHLSALVMRLPCAALAVSPPAPACGIDRPLTDCKPPVHHTPPGRWHRCAQAS